jgi:hypothetical protein
MEHIMRIRHGQHNTELRHIIEHKEQLIFIAVLHIVLFCFIGNHAYLAFLLILCI